MAGHDIIVIGASAGGIETITDLLHGMPRDLPASIFVVVHLRAGSPNVLPHILGRATVLPTLSPRDGDLIHPGRVYVCVPNQHLIVERGHVRLSRGPKENNVRPAIDPLFRSAAYSYGPRVIGVVLSGTLDDGTAGLIAIKKRGGISIVQDPDEALYGDMPRNAIEHAPVDYVVPLSRMAPLLAELAKIPSADEKNFPVPERLEIESKIAERGVDSLEEMAKLGKPSTLTCPDCGGTLWEIENGELLRFRCHVGHAFSAETLQSEQSDSVEYTLWSALRALDESIALSRQVASHAREHNRETIADRFEERAREAESNAASLRKMLVNDKFTMG